jgi:hypothetical protein
MSRFPAARPPARPSARPPAHPLAALLLAALLPAAPVWAQTPDFGTDSSAWANDGECDDPRFEGPGMTTTPLLDSDIRADATDCRAAFAAGEITLIGGVAPAPGKGGATPAPQSAGGIDFGDDSGEWSLDGECDDRRFAGTAMAAGLGWAHAGRDASDCRDALDAGRLRLWVMSEAQAATQCGAISFGDDSGDYALDGECDDIRFEGPGAAGVLNGDWVSRDASDCRQLCRFGLVALRDY